MPVTDLRRAAARYTTAELRRLSLRHEERSRVRYGIFNALLGGSFVGLAWLLWECYR